MALSCCKKMFALLREVTSKRDGDIYCLIFFTHIVQKKKLKKHYNVCKNQDRCYVEMPSEDNKILKYNHGGNSIKFHLLFMLTWNVYLKKCIYIKMTPKNLMQKKNKRTPSGYSLFTQCLFDATKNKLDCYRGKDCMKNFCKDLNLKEHAAEIINYEKEKWHH